MKTTLKLSTKKIVAVHAACVAIKDADLPIWWELARNIMALEKVITDYEANRKLIINKLAVKDEAGNFALIDGSFYDFGENKEKADKLLSEVSEEEHEIELYQVSRATFGDARIGIEIAIKLMDTVLVD